MAGLDLERSSAAVALALAAAVAGVALWVTAPPDPLPASVPAPEFSAERAMSHVRAIAGSIRPIGSEAHSRARDYLVDQLRSLGLDPQVQTAWAGAGRGGRLLQGRVENIAARIEGEGGSNALALVSHYDSVPSGPGAADAAAGSAAVLETARALLAGPALRNDVILLVTDGEEMGLLGARAFAAEHPWMEDVDLVLNFEARGNSGPVTMFETSDGNGRLVSELAAAAPYPWASSLSHEVYRRMPNDTDFTVFREAGAAGLNFALVGNHAAYHTELDTPELLDQGTLQHVGSYALALARRFGDLDLSTFEGPDAVYFNPFGFTLVVYPASLARWMAIATLLLLGVALGLGGRRNALDSGGVVRGLLAGLGVPLLCALVLGALWNVFTRAYPEVSAAPHGDPYQARWILLAYLLVAVGLATFVSGMLEATRSGSLRAGALVLWALMTCGLSLPLTGASYLMLWPTLLGAVALLLAVLLGGGARDQTVGLMLVVPVAAAALFTPVVWLVGEALTVGAAPVLGALIGLPLTLLLPDLKEALGGRLLVPVVSVLAGVGLLVWVGWTTAPGPATPGMSSLYYALDTDASEAWFVSYETGVSDWTSQVFPADLSPGPQPEFLPAGRDGEVLSIAAPVLDLAPPEVALMRDSFEQDIRTLTVRVRSPRGAAWISLVPNASMATILAMGVEGHVADVVPAAEPWLLMLQGVPAEGVEVTFRVEGRQPFTLEVLDSSFGLPKIEGLALEPRPEHLMRSTRWLTDTTNVYRSVWF